MHPRLAKRTDVRLNRNCGDGIGLARETNFGIRPIPSE